MIMPLSADRRGLVDGMADNQSRRVWLQQGAARTLFTLPERAMSRTRTGNPWFPCLLLSCFVAVAAAQSPPRDAGRPGPSSRASAAWSAFDQFFSARLAEQGIVGASFLLLRDHGVAHARTFGLADLKSRRPVDADTIFHWASITKTFTAVAIMQLRDRGLLSLDDSVVKFLPELRQVHNPFGPMDAITLRMLMSHSAGFRMSTWPWGGDQDWHPFEPPGWAQVAAMLPYTRIEFPPGSKYSYSNPGIIFLGRIIELLTGDDYEVFVDKNILKPLEMHRTYFDTTPYHLRAHRSHSYFWKNGAPVEARFDFDTGITVSNGGLNAPLTDMAKYMDFLVGNPARQAVYDGVLRRASLDEMWKPVLPVGGADAQGAKMGLCFFLEEHGGLPLVAHSGSQNGFISHFYVNAKHRTAWVVAFNTVAEPVGPDGKGNTRQVDREVRDYVVKNVIPALAPR
jgi:CubicO group peptidase (beta-lactamase class C family)